MKSLQILRHSALQILRQPKAVLQIFLIPNALSFAAFKLAGLGFIFSPLHMQLAIHRGLMPWGLLAGVSVLSLILWLWSALAWHRFILLGEQPRYPWPPLAWRVAGKFVVTSLVIFLGSLFLVFCITLIGLVFADLAVAIVKPQSVWISAIIGGVLGFLFAVLMLRLTVNLPNAAVGGKEEAGFIWTATDYTFWTMSAIAIVLIVLRFGLGQLFLWQGITPFSTSGYILVALSESLQAIFAISIITTLYGHYVEGRPMV